jgi:DNA adenine methylase
MKRFYSPLRYPGGKNSIYDMINKIIQKNNLIGCTYVEPFSGGCGIGIRLLLSGVCNKLIINDFDYRVYSFWVSIINQTKEFCKLIEQTNVNINEWEKQKVILQEYKEHSMLEVGFATFYLNRCNRSGILKAGPIGGKSQFGNYKIDCRFRKDDLIKRIKEISKYADCIEVKNLDAKDLIPILKASKDSMLIFFDPPYVDAGKDLYLNFYTKDDHLTLANTISKELKNKKWIVTYDNKEIIAKYYESYQQKNINIQYTLESKRKGIELFITNNLLLD